MVVSENTESAVKDVVKIPKLINSYSKRLDNSPIM